jgi:hypothetical protein
MSTILVGLHITNIIDACKNDETTSASSEPAETPTMFTSYGSGTTTRVKSLEIKHNQRVSSRLDSMGCMDSNF